jgi:1-acyl-sn-glycerol-3-phosphate acyltransferase
MAGSYDARARSTIGAARTAKCRTGRTAPLGVFPSSVPDAPAHRNSNVDEIERRLIVRGGHMVARNFSTMYHDLKVLTPCTLPAKGGAILVCNHTSSLDPVLLQAAVPRVITWMMAKEYSKVVGVQWFLNAIEPILVERSGRDMAATRAALRALKDGKILGLFPEGKIEKGTELLEFQTGVALLALKSKAPVYPAYLDGSQRMKGMIEAFARPNHVTLAFGPPVPLGNEEDGRGGLEAATEKIRSAVAALASVRPRRG